MVLGIILSRIIFLYANVKCFIDPRIELHIEESLFIKNSCNSKFCSSSYLQIDPIFTCNIIHVLCLTIANSQKLIWCDLAFFQYPHFLSLLLSSVETKSVSLVFFYENILFSLFFHLLITWRNAFVIKKPFLMFLLHLN